MAGRRVLAPLVKVRVLVPQPANTGDLRRLTQIPVFFDRAEKVTFLVRNPFAVSSSINGGTLSQIRWVNGKQQRIGYKASVVAKTDTDVRFFPFDINLGKQTAFFLVGFSYGNSVF